MKITKWLRTGEVGPCESEDELLESAGILLDNHSSHEILGEVVFEAEDGKTYVMTVEAVIAEANPAYVNSLTEEGE